MVIKLNKLTIFFILYSFSLIVYSQEDKYSVVEVENIMIDSFKYGGSIQNFIMHFGKPRVYNEYTNPYPLDGYGKTFYLNYDSIKATYVEFYGKEILSKINITGNKHTVKINANSEIRVGDSLLSLKRFEKSYQCFQNQYQNKDDKKEQNFYIYILIHTTDYNFYGLLNIRLIEKKIIEIDFSFDEGA